MKPLLFTLMILALIAVLVFTTSVSARELNPEEWQESRETNPNTNGTDETNITPVLSSSESVLSVGASAISTSGAQDGACGGWSGVSGESNMMKVYSPTTMQRVVYLQCGKKVAVLEPPGCTCSAGTFRYTYSCKSPSTIYVTIPCRSK